MQDANVAMFASGTALSDFFWNLQLGERTRKKSAQVLTSGFQVACRISQPLIAVQAKIRCTPQATTPSEMAGCYEEVFQMLTASQARIAIECV